MLIISKRMYPELLQSIACNLRSRPEKYSLRAIGNLLSVSKSTIQRWINPKIKDEKCNKLKSLICYHQIIRNYIQINPTCRLKDIKAMLQERYRKIVSLSTICRYLRLLGISYKKVTIQHYSNYDKLVQRRIEFEHEIKNIPSDRIVSLDESYFYKRMIKSYGYSPIGEKCIVENRVNLKKYNLMLAIDHESILSYDIQTANFNRHNFYSFLKTKLLPKITGKVIIMDNASFHKCKEILSLIKSSGNRVLFIPPYSPQYNPVEVVFRMLKSRLCLLTEIKLKDIAHELKLISCDKFIRIFEACLR